MSVAVAKKLRWKVVIERREEELNL